MLSVILSFACAFMILKVILMLVSCFKMSSKYCMSLLHFELILACWVKILYLVEFCKLVELLVAHILLISWVEPHSRTNVPKGGYIVIPRTSKHVSKPKSQNVAGWLSSIKKAIWNPRRVVSLKTVRARVRGASPGSYSQWSPIRETTTRRSPLHGQFWCPWRWTLNPEFFLQIVISKC